jgi:pimeloyl-ACP methyl ester carboxylesterase
MTLPATTTPSPLFHPDDLKAPGAALLLLEGRAPWEFAAGIASTRWLAANAPRGDAHPVIVLPGLGANDVTTAPLRRFLAQLGHAPYPWGQGFNFGPHREGRDSVLNATRALLHDVSARHGGQPVSLVGWSLGGVYARELAKQPDAPVRCVITLGSPFAGHPRATNAWRFFEFVSGQSVHDEALIAELRRAPPVPTTSIYSKSDGIVAWRCCLNDEAQDAHTENIEVHASHLGMGVNPLALYAIADRLAQPADARRWQRFARAGGRRWWYPGSAA